MPKEHLQAFRTHWCNTESRGRLNLSLDWLDFLKISAWFLMTNVENNHRFGLEEEEQLLVVVLVGESWCIAAPA